MDLSILREYIRLHTISLEQDVVDTIEKLDSFKKNSGVVIDYIGD